MFVRLLSLATYLIGIIIKTWIQCTVACFCWIFGIFQKGNKKSKQNDIQKDFKIQQKKDNNYYENKKETEWWNDALQHAWLQLSSFFIIKVTNFLNNLFKANSHLSIIKSLKVQSVELGDQPPQLKNITVKKYLNQNKEAILVSEFDFLWSSNSMIVIQLNLNILGRSQVHCVITDISLRGVMTTNMSGLVAAIPPFSKVNCYFLKNPELDLQLKFKNSSLGTIRLGHSIGIGQAIAALVREKLIEQACKELMYPRGVEMNIRS